MFQKLKHIIRKTFCSLQPDKSSSVA